MQRNVVLFVMKPWYTDRLPYALHGMCRYQYRSIQFQYTNLPFPPKPEIPPCGIARLPAENMHWDRILILLMDFYGRPME